MIRVAYRGRLKRIAWLAEDSGRFLGQEYYDSLNAPERAKFVARFHRLGEFGQITNPDQLRNEGNDIWCIKASAHRLPCFFDGRDVLVTHGFRTRSTKMPAGEKDRALRMMGTYFAERGA